MLIPLHYFFYRVVKLVYFLFGIFLLSVYQNSKTPHIKSIYNHIDAFLCFEYNICVYFNLPKSSEIGLFLSVHDVLHPLTGQVAIVPRRHKPRSY